MITVKHGKSWKEMLLMFDIDVFVTGEYLVIEYMTELMLIFYFILPWINFVVVSDLKFGLTWFYWIWLALWVGLGIFTPS